MLARLQALPVTLSLSLSGCQDLCVHEDSARLRGEHLEMGSAAIRHAIWSCIESDVAGC